MADIRPVNDIVHAQANSVNNTVNADANNVNITTNASVASTEYWYQQAKYYAGQSAESASSASASAQIAINNAGLAELSASAANVSETNAQIWAEGTDEEVAELGGTHSSKGWVDYILENAPTATVEETETGAIITVSDIIHGETTAELFNGANGQDGADGQDGYSPSASVTQSGGTTTITITDKDGTTTENIVIPTDTSDLTNGAGYIKLSDLSIASGSANYLEYSSGQFGAKVDTTVTASSTKLITSGAVATAISNAVASVVIPKGSISAVSSLPTLTAEHLGWMYNFSAAFETTSDFVEGAGITYPAGSNVVVVEYTSGTYKYDVFAGFVDLSSYATQQWVTNQGYTTNVGTVTKVNNTSPDSSGNVSITIPSMNSSNNYVPYRSSASAFTNSTLMYNSNAMAFTGKLHIGSTSPGNYHDKGRLTIYDNTASQQTTSLALLNYGGGGGCGVAIDMYNTSANGGIPSGRFGLIDNGNYSGYLQLQVKKSGAASNPLLPAMNVVAVPATNSLTTSISFGQDEFNRVLFDLHKPEATVTITDTDKRWGGSGTTYSVTGSNKFNPRLLVAVGDIVSFDSFSTEATVTGVVSNSTTCQITTDVTLGTISNKNISVKKAYFKITDESNNTKMIVDPYGKFALGKVKPSYELDVVGTINASTDIKINGTSVLTGITSTQVTNALGYTPYDSSNPNGYISSASLDDLTNVTISNPSAGQNLTYDATNQVWKNTSTSATIAWGGITGTLTDQTDLKNALDDKYDASNPNGYTSNAGTVTSVNSTSPDSNGNVTLSIPTVNDSTITIQQGGTTVDTFTTNQSTNKTINIPNEIFVAEYGTTTFADITTAYTSGKICLVKYSDRLFQLTYKSNSGAMFKGLSGYGEKTLLCMDDDTWSDSESATYANTSLSNLSTTGQAIIDGKLNLSQLTNCILEAPNGVVTTSGLTATFKSGLKLLMPNGRNADGTMKNLEYTLSADLSFTQPVNWTGGLALITNAGTVFNIHYSGFFVGNDADKPTAASVGQKVYYAIDTNKIYSAAGDASNPPNWVETPMAIVAKGYCVYSSNKINVTPFQPVSVLKTNDETMISGWSFPSDRYQALTLGATGSSYTAPADGWFSLGGNDTGSSVNAQYVMRINSTRFGIASNTANKSTSTGWMAGILPVKKGDTVVVYYTGLTASQMNFYFVYSNGASGV